MVCNNKPRYFFIQQFFFLQFIFFSTKNPFMFLLIFIRVQHEYTNLLDELVIVPQPDKHKKHFSGRKQLKTLLISFNLLNSWQKCVFGETKSFASYINHIDDKRGKNRKRTVLKLHETRTVKYINTLMNNVSFIYIQELKF